MLRRLTLLLLSIMVACPSGARGETAVDWGSARMSLGHKPAPVIAPESAVEIAPRHTQIQRQCKRWKALATQLGETYAGYRLRETVLQRHCGMAGDDLADEIWDWPWASLEGGDVVPPRLLRVIGAWEIRCDTTGERRRCAVLHRIPVPAADTEAGGQRELIVHFVIDMVAGRETVLWRMFVPGMPATAVRPALAAVGATASELREARGQVRYRLGAKEFAEGFPACGAAGCLMESHVQRGSAVVSRLWDGKAMDLGLQLGPDKELTITIPARGFRAAFGELTRLRRDELRGARRR